MNAIRLPLLVMLLFCALPASAARLVLVYPRAEKADQPHVYPAGLDSTFVLGRVEPAEGELRINGQPVAYTARGAFLAWLPLRREDTAWSLSLRRGKKLLDSLRFDYEIAADSAAQAAAPDSLAALDYPRVLRVSAPNAHVRTMIDGSYFLFPDTGCALVATGHESGFYRLDLGGGEWGVIEDRFVTLTPDSVLPPTRLGHAVCGADSSAAWCALSLPRPLPWTTALSADGRTIEVLLYGARSGLDRIRYDESDSLLRDITWAQQAAALKLEFRLSPPATRGYSVAWTEDSLRVMIARPFAAADSGLRGKVIVVDPGHGGPFPGTIGPLGTQEKEITLRWALLLRDELEAAGADVRLTRTEDVDVPLYDRVEFGRRARADFFLSLHLNALPDSQNPLLRHGSGTYYYQSASRPAAEVLHRHLLAASGLRDDGLYYANFAVARPPDFPSVLIEAAYMIYPAEEELLQSEVYLRKLARGLADGLGEYFRREP